MSRHAAAERPAEWPHDAAGRPVDLVTLVAAGLLPEPELGPAERYRARRKLDEAAERPPGPAVPTPRAPDP